MNGYSDFCGGGIPDFVIPITFDFNGETVYHGIGFDPMARCHKGLKHEIIPGFWRRKK